MTNSSVNRGTQSSDFVSRRRQTGGDARQFLLDRLNDEPVLLLQGPRSVGKSHLLLEIAAATGAEVIDLDDLATRAALTADPALFVSGSTMVCIDECQHVPEVLDAIKAELNRDLRPGRFVLTGS